jgi:type II secretory pathway component PulF
MPWYDYRALTPGGTLITGQLEAPSHEAAAASLQSMRLDVREIASGVPPRAVAGLSAEDLTFFNEQLASMADAGIALDEGLAQLARDVESPRLRRWLDALVTDLRSGKTLEQAIDAHESHLPLLYSRVIRAGVRTGNLPATLLNLNEHLRMAGRTRRIIWETLSYPIIVALLAVAVVGLFLTFVVPQFVEIFADFDVTLPLATRFVIGFGVNFPSLVLLFGAAVAVLALVWRMLRTFSGGRAVREACVGALPAVGVVHRSSLLARFTRAVATAVGNGLPLPEALRLGAGATGSELLAEDAERLAASVESGDSIMQAARTSRIIPQLFAFCVQAARSRDALPASLGKLANAYEQRAEHTQTMLRTILLPVIIIVLGGFLAICILSIFLPLVALVQSMTG